MKIKFILVSMVLLLLTPAIVANAAIDTHLNAADSYTTGTDAQFDVELSNFTAQAGSISILTIANASLSDIKSVKFFDQSDWITLTPYQNPTQSSETIAKFISDTGFNSNGKRVISIRVNFNIPKNYVLGYTLQTGDGKILSSAATPITVTGAVLGTTTSTIPSVFTRPLSYGKSGDDVRALQERLTSEGVYSGPVTGFFGRLTQAAVKKYQTQKNIRPVNGVVGPQTQAALNQ